MSNLENLVPPLELCKKIPAGEFEDSALVWEERTGISRNYLVKLREPEDISYKVELTGVNYFPAPTLEEILDDLFFTAVFCKGGIWIIDRFYEYPTESEEALRLWLTVKGIPCE